MTQIEQAKQDLKKQIIIENSEEYYYKLIAERVKPFYELKKTGDSFFGENNEVFRDEVIKTTLKKNIELDETRQLYELVMTHIALDVLMDMD